MKKTSIELTNANDKVDSKKDKGSDAEKDAEDDDKNVT